MRSVRSREIYEVLNAYMTWFFCSVVFGLFYELNVEFLSLLLIESRHAGLSSSIQLQAESIVLAPP